MATMGQTVARNAVIVQREPHATLKGSACSVVRTDGLESNVMVRETRFFSKIHSLDIVTNTAHIYVQLSLSQLRR